MMCSLPVLMVCLVSCSLSRLRERVPEGREREWAERKACPLPNPSSSLINAGPSMALLRVRERERGFIPSAEPAGDVVLGLLLRGLGEDLLGDVELDQLAQVHEGGTVGDARGLLHVVGDHHDGVVVLEV